MEKPEHTMQPSTPWILCVSTNPIREFTKKKIPWKFIYWILVVDIIVGNVFGSLFSSEFDCRLTFFYARVPSSSQIHHNYGASAMHSLCFNYTFFVCVLGHVIRLSVYEICIIKIKYQNQFFSLLLQQLAIFSVTTNKF